MIMGLLMVAAGVALWIWTVKRAFERRNRAGVEEFRSFGHLMGSRSGEMVVRLLAMALILFGALWAFANLFA